MSGTFGVDLLLSVAASAAAAARTEVLSTSSAPLARWRALHPLAAILVAKRPWRVSLFTRVVALARTTGATAKDAAPAAFTACTACVACTDCADGVASAVFATSTVGVAFEATGLDPLV